MAFDAITCWHVDMHSSATRAIGEHRLDDVARHVADARPRRRLVRIGLRPGRTDLWRGSKQRRPAQRLSASASS
jgi:hypothetical protein